MFHLDVVRLEVLFSLCLFCLLVHFLLIWFCSLLYRFCSLSYWFCSSLFHSTFVSLWLKSSKHEILQDIVPPLPFHTGWARRRKSLRPAAGILRVQARGAPQRDTDRRMLSGSTLPGRKLFFLHFSLTALKATICSSQSLLNVAVFPVKTPTKTYILNSYSSQSYDELIEVEGSQISGV